MARRWRFTDLNRPAVALRTRKHFLLHTLAEHGDGIGVVRGQGLGDGKHPKTSSEVIGFYLGLSLHDDIVPHGRS